MNIRANLLTLKRSIPPTCTLVAVTKTHPAEVVKEAYDAGHRVFGENKVQELVPKYEALPKDIQWHIIGHLQSNKVRHIAPFVTLIHSIDSIKLLEEVNKQAVKVKRTIPVLLQVHIAKEETKFGFSDEEIMSFAGSIKPSVFTNVEVHGLMGMATFTDNADQVRAEFRKLKTLFSKLRSSSLPNTFRLKELSMGMSGDYRIAIEEGSTMIRVGSAIFGTRSYK